MADLLSVGHSHDARSDVDVLDEGQGHDIAEGSGVVDRCDAEIRYHCEI